MDLSIVIAAKFEISTYAELLDQICHFVQEEIRSPSLPPLPAVYFGMENGTQFTGIPLKIIGKDPNKLILIITSDPIERPINTAVIPFAKIQSLQLIQSETIMHLLIKKELEQNTAFKGVTLAAIRNHFEVKWKGVATQNGLLPYIYLNWDEVGNSEFEKQNIVIITTALTNAIGEVTRIESKKNAFNKLKTLQISSGTGKEVQFDKQGAFLILRANFARSPSLSIEKEFIALLSDILQ